MYLFRKSVKGFTLVELMVSIAIMGMMTGFLLLNYPDSALRVSLVNSVQSIELLIKEAQIRGSAIDAGATASLGGYGVYMKIEDPTSGTQSTVVLFGDTIVGVGPYGINIGDGLFKSSSPDETSSILTLPSGFRITNICVRKNLVNQCVNNSGESLTISFTRPSANPNIYLNNNPLLIQDSACIEIQSRDPDLTGHTRSINVYHSGMISNAISACQP